MPTVPHAEKDWPGVAASVGEARRFVSKTLVGWDAEEFEWAAAALVSELATNAVLHAGTKFAVALTLDADRLRLEVKDGSSARPVVRHYDDESTTGRGLRLVVQLSEQWGIEPHQESKTVWCVMTAAAPATTETAPGEDADADLDALLAQFGDDAAEDDPATEAAAPRSAYQRWVA